MILKILGNNGPYPAPGRACSGYLLTSDSGDTRVLIDCGLSRKRLLERAAQLGVDMGRVGAVLLTHEHSDHVSGAGVFCRRFAGDILATAGTVAACARLEGLPITTIRNDQALELCGMSVQVFSTSHDVADPVGFRFEAAGDALGFCTDTGVLLPRAAEVLSGCRILAIESNHDERMLATGPYPYYLKRRVGGERGHLSNRQCADALPNLVTSQTQLVVGMHLSENNNLPSVAARTLAEAVGAEVSADSLSSARTPDGRLAVRVAAQDRPVTVW